MSLGQNWGDHATCFQSSVRRLALRRLPGSPTPEKLGQHLTRLLPPWLCPTVCSRLSFPREPGSSSSSFAGFLDQVCGKQRRTREFSRERHSRGSS